MRGILMNRKIATAVVGALWCVAAAPPAGAQAEGPVTTLVSRGGNDWSGGCDVAAGGRAVAFMSRASNLVRRDTNGVYDVFLASGDSIERVSVTSRERQSATVTSAPAISDDGSRVAFASRGYRLTDRDGRRGHHFVRDVEEGVTERVTVAAGGGPPNRGSTGLPAISGDGRHVAFHSHARNLTADRDPDDNADVFLRDVDADRTRRIVSARDGGWPNAESSEPVVSQNGRFVAFTSAAWNLVRNDDNRMMDVFRHDRKTGRTLRVSIASDGAEGTWHSFRPAISGDGRFVAFESESAFDPADTNARMDVYVHDALTGTTELVSTGPVGVGNAFSLGASISTDGRYVAFTSEASNLVAGDTNAAPPMVYGSDVFVRDLVEDETTRVSVGHQGQEGTHDSNDGAISPDGAYVCWTSVAPNLVPGDDNDTADVFLRGPLWGE